MPVKFKGSSEYVNNFKWNNSYRSQTFVPKFQQIKRDAGLRSDQIFSMQEPKICSKKHVWHREPQVQSCLMWWPEDENDIASDTRSDLSEPKQKVVSRETKAEKPLEDSEAKVAPKRAKTIVVKEVVSPKQYSKSVQYTPRKKNASTATTSQYQKNKFVQTPPKPSYFSPKKSIPKNETQLQKSAPLKSSPNKMQDKMVDSPEKSVKTIPMQRKAGIAKTRSAINRLSEYQKMYNPPRSPVKSSPLISALDIVHKSSSAVAPPLRTKPVYRTTSEYNANFCRKFKPVPVQDPIDPPSPSMKAKVKNIQNPQKLLLPHATSVKKVQSEYSREFAEKDEEGEVAKRLEEAEENKQRHEGTHIDPEHLMQVPSKTNKFWDMSSQGSASGGADDVEELESDCLSTGKYKDNCSVQSVLDSDSTYKDQLSTIKPKIAWSEGTSEDNEDKSEHDSIKADNKSTSSILEGRVTTPRIHAMNGALRTHHDLTTPCKGGAILVAPPSIADSCGSYVSIATSPITTKSNLKEDSHDPKQNSPTTPRAAGRKTSDLIPLVTDRKIPLTKRTQQNNFVEDPPIKQNLNKTSPIIATKSASPLARKRSPIKKTVKKSSEKENRPKEDTPEAKTFKKPKNDFKFATMRAPIRGSLNTVEFQHCGPGPKTMPLNFSELCNEDDRMDNISLASSRVSTQTQDLFDKAKSRKQFWSTK